jgi:glucose/arabinose dehydrogenase
MKFPDAPFHGVDVESIIGEEDVWSRQARVTARKGRTFDLTVGSRSHFFWSFRMPFYMEWMRKRYVVMMRSGRARLE